MSHHERANRTHDDSDFLPHCRFIAVDGAVAAGGLAGLERAVF